MSRLPDVAATLIVLAKSPRPGLVKTRLCPPCTPTQAADLAAAALADTLEAAAAVPAVRHLLVLDGSPPGPSSPWSVPAGVEVVAQVDGGLDVRLTAAFAAARGPALLVGMDTPQVTSARLAAVLTRTARLRPDEAQLGMAADGGWWAIGLPAADPAVFLGVPTSEPTTGAAQWSRLRSLGYAVEALPAARDVDRWDDAVAVAALGPGTSRRFPAAVAAVGSAAAVGA